MMNPSSLIRKYFKLCLEKQYCAEGVKRKKKKTKNN